MKIALKNNVPNINAVLEDFLFYAIYVPPGERPPNRDIIKQPDLASYINDWGSSDDTAVFALDDGTVVGACWSRCFPESSPGYGFIQPDIPELSIAVSPAYRGKGIGSQLIAALLNHLKNRYSAVSLSVSRENPAKRLYKRFGFEVVAESPDSLVMKKQLNL